MQFNKKNKFVFFSIGIVGIILYNLKFAQIESIKSKDFSNWIRSIYNQAQTHSPINISFNFTDLNNNKIKSIELNENSSKEFVLRILQLLNEIEIFKLQEVSPKDQIEKLMFDINNNEFHFKGNVSLEDLKRTNKGLNFLNLLKLYNPNK